MLRADVFTTYTQSRIKTGAIDAAALGIKPIPEKGPRKKSSRNFQKLNLIFFANCTFFLHCRTKQEFGVFVCGRGRGGTGPQVAFFIK